MANDKTLEEKLLAERETLLADDRLTKYKPAAVMINAPLALEQCAMGAKLHLIERILGLPLTKLPSNFD